jgi:hypothetical protein
MSRRMATILTTGAALGAAAVLAATPALAAQPVTVTNPNADNHFTAATDLVLLTDDTSGVGFECAASDSTGSIVSGSYTTPADVGDVNVAFESCSGPLGPGTATSSGQPYNLTITGVNSNGTSDGYVGPVTVHAATLGCEFDVTGNAPARYNNSTGVLSFTPDVTLPAGVAPLAPANINGCFGLVSPGDTLLFEADYQLSSPATPVTIS